MSVKRITKASIEQLIKDGKRTAEIAQELQIPKSRVKEGMEAFGLKFPRAVRGGNVIVWVTDEAENETTETIPTTEVKAEDDLRF